MQSTSEILKKRRTELGLSIEEVSSKLKIQKKYIYALEEGDSSVYDSMVIARGFLIKYCRLLGIDSDKTVAFWRRDFNIKSEKKPREKNFFDKFYFTPRVFMFLIFFLFTFFIILFSSYQYYIVKKPPSLKIYEPKDGLNTDLSYVVIKGKASNNADVFLNNKKLKLSDSGDFSEKVYLVGGFNKFFIKAVSPYGTEQNKILSVYAPNIVSESSSNNLNKLTVIARGSIPTFVEIKDTDRQVFSGYLMPGVEKIFEGNNLFIYTDSIENLDIFFNGEKVEIKDKEGGIYTKNFNTEKEK